MLLAKYIYKMRGFSRIDGDPFEVLSLINIISREVRLF